MTVVAADTKRKSYKDVAAIGSSSRWCEAIEYHCSAAEAPAHE
jgi:hypothetical protein